MACKHKTKVWDNGWCNVACMYCTLTQEISCKHNHQTNADRIRAMTDEELANFLDSTDICDGHALEECALKNIPCKVCILDWLKRPTED